MQIRVTKRKSGKVIIDKHFAIDKNAKIINLILRFQSKGKNGHTRNRYVRYRWIKSLT